MKASTLLVCAAGLIVCAAAYLMGSEQGFRFGIRTGCEQAIVQMPQDVGTSRQESDVAGCVNVVLIRRAAR